MRLRIFEVNACLSCYKPITHDLLSFNAPCGPFQHDSLVVISTSACHTAAGSKGLNSSLLFSLEN